MKRQNIFISVAGILVVAFAMAVLIYKNIQPGQQGSSGGGRSAIFERQGAPIKGPVDAKVTIVEFFDPACETCADFYPLVKQLIDKYPGKVRVMMRYAPFHRGSDEVVKMLEAAHLQGKFFPALELLFKNQRRWTINHVSQPNQARGILNGLAMDHERLTTDMTQPDVLEAVQQDIRDVQAFNIKATPEFFVNGRSLPSFGFKQLSQMVEKAVEDAY
jgi:protein-disulfide isomerase